MSIVKIGIGTALIASPFVAVNAVIVETAGWQPALFVWGFTAAVLAVITAGVALIDGA